VLNLERVKKSYVRLREIKPPKEYERDFWRKKRRERRMN